MADVIDYRHRAGRIACCDLRAASTPRKAAADCGSPAYPARLARAPKLSGAAPAEPHQPRDDRIPEERSFRSAQSRLCLRRRHVGSAAGGGCEGAADSVHTCRVELGDRLCQERSRNGAQVVQADRAVDRHPVGGAEFNLAVDPAERAGDQRNDNVAKSWDRFVAGEDEDRTAALLLELEPDDVAARYQRSSRMASRALAIAQASSPAWDASDRVQ